MRAFHTLFVLSVVCPLALGAVTAQSPKLAEFGEHAIDVRRVSLPVMVHADVDGDGDQDLITVDPRVRVLLNDGTGVFAPHAQGALPNADEASQIIAQDFDGDGDIDLYLRSFRYFAQSHWLGMMFSNDGTGRFTDVTALRLAGGSKNSAGLHTVAGDIDGDGRIDLVVAQLKQFLVLTNRGTGQFSARVLPFPRFALSLALGDIDGDGDLDLAANESWTGLVHRFVNDGKGNFTPGSPQSLLFKLLDSQRMWLVDIDSDGDVDFVSQDAAGQTIAANDGKGAFFDITSSLVGANLSGYQFLELEDFDQDGAIDLVATDDTTTSVFMNGVGGFRLMPAGRLSVPESLVAVSADFNGDGSLDTILGTGAKELPRVLLRLQDSQSRAYLVDANRRDFDQSRDVLGMVSADIDHDGVVDLVTLEKSGIYVNRPTKDSQRARSQIWGFSQSPGLRPIVAGDFDGDGLTDVMLPGQLFTRKNGSLFLARTVLKLDGIGLAAGDLDGDGDLDFVTSTEVAMNDGAGKLSVSQALVTSLPFATKPLIGDVDGDSDLDLVFLSAGGTMLRNDGRGHFSAGIPITSASFILGESRLGDLDGDGDLDIVGASLFETHFLINDGTGRFSAAPTSQWPVIPGSLSGVELLDIDSDGDLDVWFGRPLFRDRVLENDGQGRFTDSGSSWIGADQVAGRLAKAADFDGDGDMDFAVVGGGLGSSTSEQGLILLRNRTRQIHSPVMTRNGGTLRLDYHVTQGSARMVLPWIDVAVVKPLLFPGIGSLYLDPNSMVLLPAVTVNATTGVTSVSYPLPTLTSSLPVSFAMQAAVVHDLSPFSVHMSNWIKVTVHN